MKKCILSLFVVGLLAIPAFAEQWECIGYNVYLDKSSIKNQGNNVFFTVKVENPVFEHELNRDVKYGVKNMIVNCTDKTAARKAVRYYDSKNTPVISRSYNNVGVKYEGIKAGTAEQYVYDKYCKAK